jgi:predicted AlkP superfamily phosphohydrolase/phosphomutase
VLALLQFDSVSLPLLEQMLQAGRMPALASLRERGSWQRLEMDPGFFEGYPTLYSGTDEGQHGIYYWFPWVAAEQRVRYMDALPKPETVWERVARAGGRSLIIDPFQMWPPKGSMGVGLTGWQFAHKLIEGWSMPRGTYRRLARRFGRAPVLDATYGHWSASRLLALRRDFVAAPGRAAAAAAELLARERFDLVWVSFIAAHQAGHFLWDLSQVSDSEIDPDAREKLESGLEDVYAAADAALARILAALPAAADVIVFSPLGMGPESSRSDLLPELLQAVLGDRPGAERPQDAGAGSAIWRLRAAMPAGWRAQVARPIPGRAVREMFARLYMRGVDWSRTRAFALPGDHHGYVRLNLRGRERDGILEPREGDALMDEIAAGLTTFRDPDGSPSVASVERVAERITGPRVEQLPDLVVRWSDRPSGDLTHVSSPRFGEVARQGAGSGRSGNHTDGAWAILVPAASRRRQSDGPARVIDIPATACALLGADTAGMGGTPLLEPA